MVKIKMDQVVFEKNGKATVYVQIVHTDTGAILKSFSADASDELALLAKIKKLKRAVLKDISKQEKMISKLNKMMEEL